MIPSEAASVQACILVAEDEESIRDICRRVLCDAGYSVLEAANGRSAIDILREKGASIDLVLADVIMPLAGGEAITDYMRQSELDIPIIYTSGYGPGNARAAFLDREGVVLLRKPYTLSQLLLTVKTALGQA